MLLRPVLFLCLAILFSGSCFAKDKQPPLLKPQLDKMTEGFAKRAPEALIKTFEKGVEDVRKTGILEKAAKVGDKCPKATLLGPDGKEVELAKLWADGPLVLTFYRGGWCPYCDLQLKNLQKSVAAIEGAGARVVAVTPELPGKAKATVKKHKLDFLVLTDKHNQFAKQLRIAFKLPPAILPFYRDRLKLANFNGDEDFMLPLAATYLVDSKGVFRYAFLDVDYKKRAEPRNVAAAIRKMK